LATAGAPISSIIAAAIHADFVIPLAPLRAVSQLRRHYPIIAACFSRPRQVKLQATRNFYGFGGAN
jgi:hypothetical protein